MEKAIKKYFPVFALPTLVAFTIGFIVPFIMGIYLSFCEFTTVTDAKFVGLKNYLRVFSDPTFMHALWFTALFTIVSVLTINVFAFVIAMLLTKGIKGTNFFRTVFFMPNLIGGIVLGYIWQILLNGILGHFGRTLTYSSSYGFWGLIILMNWQQVGYMMIIYVAGLQNVPTDLIEAAQIDGAGPIQLFFKVTIPLLTPTIFFVMITSIISGFQVFDVIYMMIGKTNPAYANTQTVVMLFYRQAFDYGYKGYAAAISILIFAVIMLVTVIQMIGQKKWVNYD